jgi:homoprotocatechuate degradation regulator HpaR
MPDTPDRPFKRHPSPRPAKSRGRPRRAAVAHRNVSLLLLSAREAVISHFRPLLNHAGVTEQQWRILRALDEEAPLEPWQICARCSILAPSLTGVLSRMEEMGLVQRERSLADQRRIHVTPTAEGTALLRAMSPYVEAQYQLLERAIGRALYDDLLRVLDALHERLATPAPLIELPATQAQRTGSGSRSRQFVRNHERSRRTSTG